MKKIILTVIALSLPLLAQAAIPLPTNQGGTGVSTYSQGDMLVAASANPANLSRLTVGTNGQCLTSNGTLPVWGSCSSAIASYPFPLSPNGTSSLVYFYGGVGIFGSTTIQLASTTNITSSGYAAFATGGGRVGIGTTTPGSILSIGNTNGWNFSVTGTTTSQVSAGGINLMNGGCFAIAGVCTGGGGGSGTVTSVATNQGLTGGTFTTSGTVGLDLTKTVNNTLLVYNGTQLQATGTQQLTVGNLLSTTTASSTFIGGIDAARVCLTGTTSCLGASSGSSGSTITYTATSSLTDTSPSGFPFSSTTPISAGHQLVITAKCNRSGTTRNALNVGNPGGGTTTLDYSTISSGASVVTVVLQGVYNSTTTGNAFVAFDNTSDFVSYTTETACKNPSFNFATK